MTTPWQPGFQGVTVVPPGYNDPHNWSPASALQLVQSTGTAGFTLVNATPTILSWTAPNDGQSHRVLVWGQVNVTSAETGGKVQVQFNPPGVGAQLTNLDAGGHGTGLAANPPTAVIVGPGTTVNVVQATALSVGAATLWAEIWAA